MNLEFIQKTIEDHLDLIEINAVALAQSRERAGKFLVVQAILTSYLKDLEEAQAKITTIREASYAQSIKMADGKNITEKKVEAEANPEYSSYREASERVAAEINWIKGHIKIFENAHILFRQSLRE